MSNLFGKGSAPKPPSASSLASAQTGSNVGTAIANANLGYVNQVTPDGNLTYSQSGTFDWKDPSSGKTYNIPRFTATQTLSPSSQNIYNLGKQTETNLADIGSQQSGAIKSHLSQPFSFGQSQIQLPNLQDGIAGAGDIRKTYGTDFSADRQRVEDALMARMNPQLDRDREALRTQMVNQGLNIGTEAYSRGMEDFGRNVNDARYGAILSAGQEQSRLSDLEANRAGFENAAQAQQFGQNTSTAQFGNQVRQQGFANQTALQGTQDQRALTQRNQPLNEIAALLSGSQVAQPNFASVPTQQMPNTDVAGIMNSAYSNQYNAWNQRQQQGQSTLGGILGFGANLLL
jgi:hypothetical protein